MVLVRGLQIVPVAQQSTYGLSQTILVGLLGSLVQQSIGNQTGVPPVLHILHQGGGG